MIPLIIILAVLSGIGFITSAVSNRHELTDLRKLKIVTDQVNMAVNHKENGMPTLVKRVSDQDRRSIATASELVAFRGWVTTAIKAIADFHGITLPDDLDPVPVTNIAVPDESPHE